MPVLVAFLHNGEGTKHTHSLPTSCRSGSMIQGTESSFKSSYCLRPIGEPVDQWQDVCTTSTKQLVEVHLPHLVQ